MRDESLAVFGSCTFRGGGGGNNESGKSRAVSHSIVLKSVALLGV